MKAVKKYIIASQYMVSILSENDFIEFIKKYYENSTLNNIEDAIKEWQLNLTKIFPFLWIVDMQTLECSYQNSWLGNSFANINFKKYKKIFEINMTTEMMPLIILQLVNGTDDLVIESRKKVKRQKPKLQEMSLFDFLDNNVA